MPAVNAPLAHSGQPASVLRYCPESRVHELAHDARGAPMPLRAPLSRRRTTSTTHVYGQANRALAHSAESGTYRCRFLRQLGNPAQPPLRGCIAQEPHIPTWFPGEMASQAYTRRRRLQSVAPARVGRFRALRLTWLSHGGLQLGVGVLPLLLH